MNIAQLPNLNSEQRAAATAPADLPLLVVASAGTGKTTLVVARVMHLIHTAGVEPWMILVLVFTRQAAKEARERLKLYGIRDITVGTFHSFGMGIIKKQYKRLGFEQQPSLLKNDDDAVIRPFIEQCMLTVRINKLLENACRWLEIPLQEATWDTIVDEIRESNPKLYNTCWKEAFCPEPRAANAPDTDTASASPTESTRTEEEDKGEDVAAAVLGNPPKRSRTSEKRTALGALLLNLPSSSPTDVLQPAAETTQPIQTQAPEVEGGNHPANGESQQEGQKEVPIPQPGTRLSSLKFQQRVAVIKAFYLGLITFRDDFWLLPSAEDEFKIPVKPSESATKEEKAEYKKYEGNVKELLKNIEIAKTRGNTPSQYRGNFQAVYEMYETTLKDTNMIDFNDMLLLVHDFLKAHPAALATLQARYQYLLVDEAQDLNPLQLATTLMMAREGRLTCVGDNCQSIYRFRGSETWTMQCIEHLYQNLNPDIQQVLTVNYRSTQNILDVARVVLKDQGKDLVAANTNRNAPPVTIMETGVEQDEGEWIRRQIQQHHAAGVPYNQMAILFRQRTAILGYSSWMQLKKELDDYNIPNKLLSERSLLNRTVVKDIKAYLALAIDPHNDQAFLTVVNRPRRGFGDAAVDALTKFRQDHPIRYSFYTCVEHLCAGENSLLTPMQAAGLQSFKAVIGELRHGMLTRDPAEFVYFVLKKTKYVLWAEVMSRNRKYKVKDDANANFDWKNVDLAILKNERTKSKKTTSRKRENYDDQEEDEGEDDFLVEIVPEEQSFESDEEESYDFSSSSSEEEEGGVESICARPGTASGIISTRMTRRRKREQEESDDGAAVNIDTEEHLLNDLLENDDGHHSDLFNDPHDSDSEEDDEGMYDEEEGYKLDPLSRYKFNLSHFKATTGPLRRLLREAALFTENSGLDLNETERIYQENRLGPPSLMRIAWNTLSRSPAAADLRERLHESHELQTWAARLKIGPLLMMDFMDHVFESKQNQATTLDTNNVVLATIHGAKGLEWDVVFLPRFNKDILPCYFDQNAKELQPYHPRDPIIPKNCQPPQVAEAHAHLDEETRVAHVGITRARHKLYLTMIRYQKAQYGSYKLENPSELVEEIVNYFFTSSFNPSRDALRQLPASMRVGGAKNVLEIIQMPPTRREQENVCKIWNPGNNKQHPHPIWSVSPNVQTQ